MMNKELKKHPILKILHPSDFDEVIQEVYQSTRKWSICWLACEQLEFKFKGNKVHNDLWFHATSNNIEFFNSSTNKLLAKIVFDYQLVELPASYLRAERVL